MAARYTCEDSSDESDVDSLCIADEDVEDYERHVGVQGYQFEPVRRSVIVSGSANSDNPTASSPSSPSPPVSTRTGNTDWFVCFVVSSCIDLHID